jgi:hypothetical protein
LRVLWVLHVYTFAVFQFRINHKASEINLCFGLLFAVSAPYSSYIQVSCLDFSRSSAAFPFHSVSATKTDAVVEREFYRHHPFTDTFPLAMMEQRGQPDYSASFYFWLHSGMPKNSLHQRGQRLGLVQAMHQETIILVLFGSFQETSCFVT